MMKTLILGAMAAAATLTAAGAASAQPYGYVREYVPAYGYQGYAPAYGYGGAYAPAYGYGERYDARVYDRDRDGVPDRWDRYDNRRESWRERHAWRERREHHRRYDRDDRW